MLNEFNPVFLVISKHHMGLIIREGLDGGLVFTIHLKISPLFISLKFWLIYQNKTNYSLKVRKVAKKSDFSLFLSFFFNSLKNGLFIIF